MLGSLFVGITAGAIAALVALAGGGGYLTALAVYAGTGVLATLAVGALQVLREEARAAAEAQHPPPRGSLEDWQQELRGLHRAPRSRDEDRLRGQARSAA